MKKLYIALVLILFVLPLFAQNIPSYVPKDGLVGYWPFNGNANDESGRGDHGKVNNCKLVKDRFGKENSAYYFDKNYSYIELNNENHTQISFATWVKLSNLKDTNALFSKGNAWNSDSRSYMNYCAWGLNLTHLSVGKENNYLNVSHNDTSYHFIVIVYDQKSNKYYQDGKFIKESTNIQGPINSTSQNKYLGALLNNNTFSPEYFLHGTMDEFSMWKRALTETEIQALYEGNTCPLKAAISPQGSVNICEGSSIVLQSADSTHALQWFKDNQPIVGATSKSYTATKAGQYTLKVSDLTCSTMSLATTIDTIPLPAAPALSNTYQKVCQMEPVEMISPRLTNYNAALKLRWYRNETGNDSIYKYMTVDPYPRNYYVSQLSATSPQCESPKRTMIFIDVSMPVSVNPKGNTTFCKGDSVVLEAFGSTGDQYNYAWKKDYNWIEGTEGKNTFVAKEAGRYSYQDRMCGMQMIGNEIEVVVKQGLTVNVGKITGSSVEFVWDTLSLSPRPKDFVINYGINSTSLTQTISIPGGTSYTFTGLNKGDTVRVSITPKGTDCTTPSFASAVATEIVIPSNIPTNGLVGYWPFNGNANDESGHGNHGTVYGATLTADRNGKPNSAYSFDGSNKNYIQINSKVGNFGTSNFTIALWVLSSNKISSLINKRYNEDWGNFWELRSDFFGINDDDKGINYSVLNNLNYEYNNWNNIIIIREKNKLKYYYNEKLINEVNTSIINNIFNDNNLIIGTIIAPISGVLQSHYGKIDDIAIYNRALSEQEVKQLYGVGCPKETATSSSFSYPTLTTSSPISLNAEPQGGVFSGVAVEKNQFNPSKAKIGLNKVQYNFKNSQGCNDSTLFSMIVADTVGSKCTKIDTITVKNNVYDTVTITNNVTKYDTVKVTKYDTLTIKNNIYDTVTITNNVTKYDTITLTDTVSILKIKFKLTTGIQAIQMVSMSVYPNPTTDILHIEVGDAKALDGYRYRILDALGKEVYNELVKNTITEIPLKTLGAAGLYQLEVLDANKTSIQTNKIVLE